MAHTPTATATAKATNTPIITATPTITPTPQPFPQASVQDNFNRSNGTIGSSWTGDTGSYAIASQQLKVNGSGEIYWNSSTYGANQEAYVTLSQIPSGAQEIGLVLKAQSWGRYQKGLIEVLYDKVDQNVQVWTYDGTNGWF